jgi:SAM-dependent methyltransferase
VSTPPPDAAYFDEWYTNLNASAAVGAVAEATLGLPPEFESTSLLSWDGIADVVDALRLESGDTLVDLACGRGGYGLEVARRTGARLIGVDFSAVAVERARQKALGVDADFRVGELTGTGLAGDTADAIMCVDAMQFADPYPAGLAECRRILAPGGRLVLTGWQAHDLADESVPVRMRYDIAAALTAAGFADVQVADMPTWRAAELAHWRAAIAVDTAGDAGAESLRAEGERVLPVIERTSRVFATARKPEETRQ